MADLTNNTNISAEGGAPTSGEPPVAAPPATPPREDTSSRSSCDALTGNAPAPAAPNTRPGSATTPTNVDSEVDEDEGEGLAFVKLGTEGPPIALDLDAATGRCKWQNEHGENLDIQEMTADEYLRRVQFEASRTELRS